MIRSMCAAALICLVAGGCSSPQRFSVTQGDTNCRSSYTALSVNKVRSSVLMVEDGTMNIKTAFDKVVKSCKVVEPKSGEILVSVENTDCFIWQHPALPHGKMRRLLLTVETSNVVGFNPIESWECVIRGNRLLDLDTELNALAAAVDAGVAPVGSGVQQTPAPAVAPAPTAPAAPAPAAAPSPGLTQVEKPVASSPLAASVAKPADPVAAPTSPAPSTGLGTVASVEPVRAPSQPVVVASGPTPLPPPPSE